MTAILPSQPTQGNAIVTPAVPTSFPMLILSGLIVAAGIYVVDQFDERAAWLLAFLVLLVVAFRYKGFGNEIVGLLGAPTANQQTNLPSTPPASSSPIVVGPTGPITA